MNSGSPSLNAREIEHLFSHTFPGALFVLDSDGGFRFWNDVLDQTLKISCLPEKERCMQQFVHPADRQLAEECLAEAVAGQNQQVDLRILNASAEYHEYRIFVAPALLEGKKHVTGYGLSTLHFKENTLMVENRQRLLEETIVRSSLDMLYSDALLKAVNTCAHILLVGSGTNFQDVMHRALSVLGAATGVDRVYLWRNHLHAGLLCCSQEACWTRSRETNLRHLEAFMRNCCYSIMLPNWLAAFELGKGVDGLVNTMQGVETTFLKELNVVSLLIRPIFLHNTLWGFIGFDDCSQERTWSNAEEELLQTSGMLFSAAFNHHEFIRDLRHAKEEAEAGTRAKGEFLSTISHELRTPMNAILGFTQLFDREFLNDRQKDYLSKIRFASHGLLRIINDILDMSKIESGKFIIESSPFHLHLTLTTVQSVLGFAAREKGLDMRMNIQQNVPTVVEGDSVRLNQVLVNLLNNAIKFTSAGFVCLDVQVESCKKNIATVVFRVSDSGIGLTTEQLARIFQPFSQGDNSVARKYGGTGLGLAISKQLVELMGGKIAVESTAGIGSCFFFSLPLPILTEASLAKNNSSNDSDLIDLKGAKILVVEDNLINQELACAFLETLGLKADVAENGSLAVEMVKHGHYDLVFMDVQMPVMDGLEATRLIRALQDPSGTGRFLPECLPIVAMTANAMAEDKLRCMKAGMNAHLAKPLNLADICHTLKHWIRREHGQPGAEPHFNSS